MIGEDFATGAGVGAAAGPGFFFAMEWTIALGKLGLKGKLGRE